MASRYQDVLLCVTGLTPQVVTETLFALCQDSADATDHRIPDEIQVITTTEGRRRIELSLLCDNGGHGHFHRLCADYGLDPEAIRFDASSIYVVRDENGRELADIVDEPGNAAAADLINQRVRDLTRRDDVRLHVSLAGGRKTMGFYAGYALSLYARAQDRLTHVLVNSPFESHPAFFYPPPKPTTLLVGGNNDFVSTADARVGLADIPFVRLRNELDRTLLEGEFSFREAVSRAQQALVRPSLRIDLTRREVWLQGIPVRLSPTKFAWLTWFALRAHRGEPAIAFDEAAARELRGVIEWLEGTGPSSLRDGVDAALAELRECGESNYFDRNRTRLNSSLAQADRLPKEVIERYRVQATGQRPHTRYGLNLSRNSVRIEGEP